MNKTSVKNKQNNNSLNRNRVDRPQMWGQSQWIMSSITRLQMKQAWRHRSKLEAHKFRGAATQHSIRYHNSKIWGGWGEIIGNPTFPILGFWYCTFGLMWHWSRAKGWHLPLDSSLDLGAHFVVEAGFLNFDPPFPQRCHYKTNDVLFLVIKSLHILVLITQLKLGMCATSWLIVAVSLVNIKHTRCLI